MNLYNVSSLPLQTKLTLTMSALSLLWQNEPLQCYLSPSSDKTNPHNVSSPLSHLPGPTPSSVGHQRRCPAVSVTSNSLCRGQWWCQQTEGFIPAMMSKRRAPCPRWRLWAGRGFLTDGPCLWLHGTLSLPVLSTPALGHCGRRNGVPSAANPELLNVWNLKKVRVILTSISPFDVYLPEALNFLPSFLSLSLSLSVCCSDRLRGFHLGEAGLQADQTGRSARRHGRWMQFPVLGACGI